jgi:hypothetical protein
VLLRAVITAENTCKNTKEKYESFHFLQIYGPNNAKGQDLLVIFAT